MRTIKYFYSDSVAMPKKLNTILEVFKSMGYPIELIIVDNAGPRPEIRPGVREQLPFLGIYHDDTLVDKLTSQFLIHFNYIDEQHPEILKVTLTEYIKDFMEEKPHGTITIPNNT